MKRSAMPLKPPPARTPLDPPASPLHDAFASLFAISLLMGAGMGLAACSKGLDRADAPLAGSQVGGDFALIDKAGKTLPARTRAAAGMAVLRAGGASERQFAAVQEWLTAARRDEPDSPGPLLNEGEFYALKLDYARAEAVYTAVLAKEPRNVVALNNLAWILAPQPESSAKALELIDRAVAEIGVTGELLDTRARVRIAAKQFELAEKDLTEALTQEKTGLRMFHMALAKQAQTPPKKADAATAFKQAKERGLEAKGVHPADLPQFRVLDAEALRGPS